MNTREFLIEHHTDIPHDGKPQFDRVSEGHKRRGFKKNTMGNWVGYHFLIEENGLIVQCRSLDEPGNHSYNCGCSIDKTKLPAGYLNYRSIGICLAGAMQRHKPTAAQIESLTKLTMELQMMYGLSDDKILLHRETKATACPVIDYRPLVAAARPAYYRKRKQNAENGLRYARGARRTNLERLIARINSILLSSPLPS